MKNTHSKLLRIMLALCLLLCTALTAFAEGQAVDTAAPVIDHSAVSYARQGQPLLIQATVTDESEVTAVELVYRATGSEQWQRLSMTCVGCNSFTAQLDADIMTMQTLEYYLEASDGTNAVALEPQTVLLDKGISILSLSTRDVHILEAATTPVTVIGEGFSQEMTVTVGGVEAAFTYVSETEILLALPELGICKADIVITCGENSCTRLQAITYGDPMSSVKLTSPEKVYIGQKVGFPIYLNASGSVTEAAMQIQLDPRYFTDVQFVLETFSESIQASFDIDAKGLVSLRLTSAESMAGAGPVGYLTAQIPYVEQEVRPVLSLQTASFHGVDVHCISCDVAISRNIAIQVLHIPDQMYLLEGDFPDFGSWELEIDYEGVCQRIPVTKDMITISQENPGHGKVSYFHKEVPFTFQLLDKKNTSLVIQTPASKLHYMVGEAMDLTGLSLALSYKNGAVVLPVDNYTASGFDGNKPGKQTITLSARGFTASMEVNVFQRGDINQDGKITLLDMVNVKSHVLGMSILKDWQALAADYNGDGKISILDYVQIKAVILGISTEDGT